MQGQVSVTEETPFKERLFTGGNFSVAFSNVGSFVFASPHVGYQATQRWSIGVGGIYQYRGNRTFEDEHMYGGNLFNRFQILDQVLLVSDFQLINRPIFRFTPNSQEYNTFRKNVPIAFVGAAYVQRISDRTSALFTVMYDIIQDTDYPYASPLFVSGGIAVGL